MKTQDMLIIGGVGLVLLLAFQKRAQAQQVAAANLAGSTGGRPQPGVTYSTPTQVAGAVAGAVNGILNWISGTPTTTTTPASSGTKIPGVVDVFGPDNVDGFGDLLPSWEDLGNWTGWGGSNDGTNASTNPQEIPVPSLANFWTSPFGSLD